MWAEFVELVAEQRFGDCFCMLREADPKLDRSDAAAIRRANLTAYLAARTVSRPVLCVGEAMGYNGGRFSGIAFTAERTLRGWGHPYRPSSLRPEGYAEQSGTIVHGLLAECEAEELVLLWNAVPAHPHRPGAPLTNRTPTADELRAGGAVLRELITRAEPQAIVAVGRSAERSLAELGIPTSACVRHPANGGAPRFRAGLRVYLGTC